MNPRLPLIKMLVIRWSRIARRLRTLIFVGVLIFIGVLGYFLRSTDLSSEKASAPLNQGIISTGQRKADLKIPDMSNSALANKLVGSQWEEFESEFRNPDTSEKALITAIHTIQSKNPTFQKDERWVQLLIEILQNKKTSRRAVVLAVQCLGDLNLQHERPLLREALASHGPQFQSSVVFAYKSTVPFPRKLYAELENRLSARTGSDGFEALFELEQLADPQAQIEIEIKVLKKFKDLHHSVQPSLARMVLQNPKIQETAHKIPGLTSDLKKMKEFVRRQKGPEWVSVQGALDAP